LHSERQRDDVEDDVSTRGAARWVPLRDSESRNGGLPRPRPYRRAVDLEGRHDHEHACVDGPACDEENHDEERAADRTRDVGGREHGQAQYCPHGRTRDRDAEQYVGPPSREHRQRHAREVDEAVAGRYERREVLEAIRVHTPDDRPHHLAERRDPDDREGLNPDGGRMQCQERQQHPSREDAERELTRPADLLVGQQAAGRPASNDDDRDDGEAAHHAHLRRSTGRRFDRGIRSASQSADTARMIWPVAALAVFLLGFVIVYGSRLQTRLETLTAPAQGDSGVDTDIL